MGLKIDPDQRPEQGHYYRSDHFAFAHVGIPAFTVERVTTLLVSRRDSASKAFEQYMTCIPPAVGRISGELGFLRAGGNGALRLSGRIEVANQNQLPTWRAGDEFLSAREKAA